MTVVSVALIMAVTSTAPDAGTASMDWTAGWQGAGRAMPLGSGRIVYDEARRRVVLLDAEAATVPAGEARALRSWTWDGHAWTLLPGDGPSWRPVFAAAYDTRRRRIVLFGGAAIPATVSRDDTWEADGTTWTNRANLVLPGRDHHTMAYDDTRGRTVLFGGGTFVRGQPYQWREDTWEWDGVQWRQVAESGPGARRLTGMAFDRRRNVVVLFGGVGPATVPGVPPSSLGATWLWEGAQWRRAASEGPPARYGHAMAFDDRAGVTRVYGGSTPNDEPLTDMWQWDGVRWSEIAAAGSTPGPRFGAAMAFDRERSRMVLYGGQRDDRSVWEWDGARWERVTPTGSEPAMAPPRWD